MSEELPSFSRESFMQEMRAELDQLLGEVADAVNATQGGAVITQSEEQVRELFAQMRQRAYERAIQMKIEAAQAAFFPLRPIQRRASGFGARVSNSTAS